MLFSLFTCFALTLGSCANQDCIRKSKYKQKNYRVKKLKAYQRGAGGGTATTVGAMEELVEQKQASKPEEEVVSIPDSKFGGELPKEEKKIEFQGQEIDLGEEDFMYEEQVLFVDSTDLFSDPQQAREQLKELSRLLKKNGDVQVMIIGNTATTSPREGVIYGDSKEALAQEVSLNTTDATIEDSMLARAKRVYTLLVDSGVDPSQLDYKTGSHREYRRERVVSFIISTK